MDRCGKIYIVKPLRQAGLVGCIDIVPNFRAAVIFQSGTKISDILDSLEIIMADLKHRAKMVTERNESR